MTLSDETQCPCCQWPVPIFKSFNPIFHSESPQPIGPLIHSGHRDKSWKPQRQEGTSARVPASSRPRAEIKRDPGSFGAVPRAFRSLRRSSRSQRPPAPPQTCAGGASRQRGKAGRRGRDAGGALCAGARRPASSASAPRRAARALPLSPAPPDGPGPRFTPTRPGVRVLPPACRPGASACFPAAAPRGPGSRSRCRPGRRGRGQPLPLPHLPRPLPAFSAFPSPSLGPPLLLQMR